MLTIIVRRESQFNIKESESGDYITIQFGDVAEIELSKSHVRKLLKLLIKNLHDSGWNLNEIKKIINY